MADNPLLAEALRHVEMGFAVVSVWSTNDDGTCKCGNPHDGTKKLDHKSIGKHPIPNNGFKSATRDIDRVTTMLSAASMPNYGVVWPKNAPGVVLIWDVDGDGWQAKIEALKATYGPLPKTKTTRTPSGGLHLFYTWPINVPIPDGDHLHGFVVRWPWKGIAVGPGSRINGSTYTDVGDEPMAELPVAWAEGGFEPKPGGGQPLITVTGGGYEVPDVIPVGSRHSTIIRFIASRWNKGIPKDEIEASVRAIILPRCVEPMDEARVRMEIDEGFATAEKKWETPGGSREYGEPPPSTTSSGKVPFPEPPDKIAFDGTVGEIVALMDGHTTADPVARLATTLTVLGALCPRYLDFHGRQPTALLTGIVAETGEGKGTSMTYVSDVVRQALGLWFKNRLDGMGSGEGFVRALVTRREGVLDKAGNYVVAPMDPVNVIAVEEELGSFMAKRSRDGSILDHEVRKSFDSTRLSTGRSDSTVYLNPPYWFASVGHITPKELRAKIGSLSDGSANRWLWIAARELDGKVDGAFPVVPQALRDHLVAIRDQSLTDSDKPLILLDPARDLIDRYRTWLKALPGSRELTTRLPIIALRIGMIHTVLDGYIAVDEERVARGIALTEYARDGLVWVFGVATGDRRADTLALAIRESEGGLSGRDLERLVRDATDRREAIERLVEMGLVRVDKVTRPGGGNPAHVHVWTGLAAGSSERFKP
jgi:hypothetical protein